MPITDDPTYKGCAVKRYGPEDVTSVAFCTWPAAQIRIASPTAAMALPIATLARVGDASHSTTTAKAKPSGTRLRASATARQARVRASAPARAAPTPASRSDTGRLGGESALDSVQHLLDFDIHQAHRAKFAATKMQALARRVARHDDVGRRPRSV